MKIITTTIFVLLSFVTFGQNEYSLFQFYGKELGIIQGKLGGDSILIRTLEKIDIAEVNYHDDNERKRFHKYNQTEKFELDSTGTVKNYSYFVGCPVGEWLPTLLKFEISDKKILMLVEYNFWDKKLKPRLKEYLYDIENISANEILLTKINGTTNVNKDYK